MAGKSGVGQRQLIDSKTRPGSELSPKQLWDPRYEFHLSRSYTHRVLGGGLSAGLKSPDPANHSKEGLLSCHVCQNMHLSRHQNIIMFQFSSVTQSCPTFCDPMNHSTPGLPVHHQLPDFTQTHVHRVGNAIQPSHPLSSPFPPAPNPSQHQSLFQWVNFLRITGFQLWCFTEPFFKNNNKKLTDQGWSVFFIPAENSADKLTVDPH